jgi:2-dehydro-3-deoxyphosphogluconate aldolase / (4S)-4-hydroxy-2-oxoglutarate aldolase
VSVEQDMLTAGIIPVVVLEDHGLAVDLAGALLAGRIPVAEVTFRTSAAAASIKAMAQVDGMLVGAGTVVTPEQVDQAVDAGARFVVSPGLLPAVVERAQARGVVALPGAVTPSEIMTALSLGIETVKFFPANVYGGAAAIKALGAPFGRVRFIPTGGVSLDNLPDFLGLPNVPAVGGTWMVKPELLRERAFDQVTELSRRAVEAAAAIRKDKP